MRFVDFARAHGVLISELIDDGEPHRVPTEDHPRKRNGAYMFNGNSGWVQNWAVHERAIPWRSDTAVPMPANVRKTDIAESIRKEQERHARAAARAAEIIARCSYDVHPYLARKGFPNERGLIDTDGRLVIPMRSLHDYSFVSSVQWIPSEGRKDFLKDGRAKESVFHLGVGRESWLVEGFATGLSVREALRLLHRPARVVVCFSAGNLKQVASMIPGRRFVIADNDKSGTGCRVAEATGLPWGMPDVEGFDANDLHQKRGIREVILMMRDVIGSTKKK